MVKYYVRLCTSIFENIPLNFVRRKPFRKLPVIGQKHHLSFFSAFAHSESARQVCPKLTFVTKILKNVTKTEKIAICMEFLPMAIESHFYRRRDSILHTV